MLRRDEHLDKSIGKELVRLDEAEREKHVSSGLLSASWLGDPLQWQVLKVLGVQPQQPDEYVLRKFLRGKQAEAWLVGQMQPLEQQKEMRYRSSIGYADAIIDTKDWDTPSGIIPAEIKSTKSSNWKYLLRDGPQHEHRLQAGMYAIAMGAERFAIVYVCSDDLRVLSFVLDTMDVRGEINLIIDRFEEQLKKKFVPEFEAPEHAKWKAKKEYSRYPDWMDLKQDAIDKKVAELNIKENNYVLKMEKRSEKPTK